MLYGIIPGLGGGEIVLLLVLGVLLFGRKLPDIGRSFGQTITSFRHGLTGVEESQREPRIVCEPGAVKLPQRVASAAPGPV